MIPKPNVPQELLDRRYKAARADAEALRGQVTDVLDRITDGLILLDREWRYAYLNDLAQQFMRERGRTPEAVLGEVIWEAFPGLLGTVIDREFHRAALEATPVRFEFYSADVARWLEIRAYPSRDGLSVYFHDINDRKQAETDLRRVTTGARCILWHGEVEAGDGWMHWDTRFFDEASVLQKFPFDREPGESFGDAWWRSRLPEDRDRAGAEASAAILTGQTHYRQEFRHRLRDGRVVWFLQTVTVERQGPNRWGLVGVCVDITDRKRAEAELSYVLRHARCILWNAEVERVEGREGPFLHWRSFSFDGDAAQALVPLEVPPGETYQGAWWHARTPEQDRRMTEVSTKAFLSGAESYQQNFTVTDRYGQERWLHEEASIQPQGEGKWRAVGVITDITQHKRMEAALREREGRLRDQLRITDTLANTAAEALFMMDAGGRATFLNPAAEAMFGWTLEEIRGKVLHDVIHPVHPDGTPFNVRECPLGRTIFEGVAVEKHEDLYLRRDGSFVPVLCSNAPIVTEGKVTGAVLVVHDMTERKALEDALRRRAEELTEADARKNEFLSMLAHELRNPMGAISNSLYLLDRTSSQEEGPVRIRKALQRQVDTLSRLVDDLLDVNRIDRNKIDLRVGSADLGTILRDAVETVQPQIDERGHQLSVTLPPEPVALEADAARLVQVVGNLLHNAAKYTPPGGEIALNAAVEGATDAPWVAVRVRDNGTGIAPELLPRLFDLFTQGSRGLDRSEGGLGIGLTVVKRLTEMHGGTVEAHSEGPGRGAEFVVRLPLRSPVPAEDRGDSADRGVSAAEPAPGIRVLVVEDMPDSAELLGEVLRTMGHEARVALDGASALEAAREFRPQVALIDLGLPGMDGYDLARAIRERYGDAILLAALTGYGHDDALRRSEQAGFDAHLVKPLDMDRLREVLSKVFNSHTVDQE